MARMGQCFSTSLDAIGIDVNEGTSWHMDEDIKTFNEGYCFSDGVGKISESLVRQVRVQTYKLCNKRDIYQHILDKMKPVNESFKLGNAVDALKPWQSLREN